MKTLESYLQSWDAAYNEESVKIPLFNPSNRTQLTSAQKQLFAKAFYHARGHFYRFLWMVGSFAETEDEKRVVIDNIMEEFGGRHRSHERLYFDFAESLGVDVVAEIQSETAYAPFLVAFNKAHIDWLLSHDWNHKWAAFSAYERLDNIDYENLYRIASAMNLGEKELRFFDVHRHVKHFDGASVSLLKMWEISPDSVKSGFEFIGQHQLKMWRNLSNLVLESHE